jgi:hypothetical protein
MQEKNIAMTTEARVNLWLILNVLGTMSIIKSAQSFFKAVN